MKEVPTALGERIEALDLMRGFALLGILIANMLFFHTPILYIDPHSWFSTPSDVATYKWIAIFIQGSFYPIFAILFGYGLNMQYEKAVRNGSPFAPVLARRLTLLLVFGLIHGLLIWAGDILMSYAVMGFLLILFVRIPVKWLLPIAFVLYVLPMGGLLVLIALMEKLGSTTMDGAFVNIHQVELSISAYAHGNFMDIMAQRFHDWLQVGVVSGIFLGFFMILPLLLLGAVFSKWKVIERAGEMKRWLAVGAVLFIAAGIWLKALPFTNGASATNQFTQEAFGGVILALGYIALFLLLSQIRLFRSIFRPVAKAGRMSLTTYITQSIVATLIFYAYGLGLYGKVDLETGTWIALGIFVIQVIFAEVWLSKFRMGPLEWLWRRATYGKKLSN
ncbi:DUF418 domain-containing protein [Sporosarcina sp. 179-K 3D1 HS]|uniref:DUF418 domain-containing protein n=1 Tax=Sporosarcina sp. 179-K 3D1 HS TaxID=3232169 RepID=UPI00399F1444